MARTGRPPKPLEQHKRTGTWNATRHGKRQGAEFAAGDSHLVLGNEPPRAHDGEGDVAPGGAL